MPVYFDLLTKVLGGDLQYRPDPGFHAVFGALVRGLEAVAEQVQQDAGDVPILYDRAREELSFEEMERIKFQAAK